MERFPVLSEREQQSFTVVLGCTANLFCIKLDPVDMLRNTIEFYLCLIFFS